MAFQCPLCPVVKNHRSHLRDHFDEEHRLLRYNCSTCSSIIKTRVGWGKHQSKQGHLACTEIFLPGAVTHLTLDAYERQVVQAAVGSGRGRGRGLVARELCVL